MSWTEQQINALLASVGRIAVSYERMLAIQEKKIAAPQVSQKSEQKRAPKGDLLTTTGLVVNFGNARDRTGLPKTTKKGNEYWQLKLDNGFECMIFSGSQAATCSKAFDEGILLLVMYVVDGKYNNIDSVDFAPGPHVPTKQRADYDDSPRAEEDPF